MERHVSLIAVHRKVVEDREHHLREHRLQEHHRQGRYLAAVLLVGVLGRMDRP
jgi:hypothetical protein